MTSRQIVLCHPVRTAIGTYGGSLKDMPAPELGAAAIRETLKRSGLAAFGAVSRPSSVVVCRPASSQ